MPLNVKQIRFCQHYAISLNASKAAEKAGYSKKTAYSIGQRLLKNVEIKKKISQLTKKTSDTLEITRERVLAQYGRIAFFDIRTIFSDKNTLKPIKEFDDSAAAAIAGIDVDELMISGEYAGLTKKIKTRDSKAALDSICRVNGWNIDKVDHTSKGKPMAQLPVMFIPADQLTQEQIQQYLNQYAGTGDESVSEPG